MKVTISHFWNYGNLREIFRSVARTVAPESHCPTLQSATDAGKDSRLQAQPRMGISGMNRSGNFDGPRTARLDRYRLVFRRCGPESCSFYRCSRPISGQGAQL